MTSIHKAVLLQEVLNEFDTLPQVVGGKDIWYLDGTIGGAGHALSLIERRRGNINVIALDRDQEAIERAKITLDSKAKRLILEKENFRDMDKVLNTYQVPQIDFLLLDLGLSSDELESSNRGFSFLRDEPLLMTMDANPAFTASDIVNSWKEEDIANVIFAYGEERWARRIARAIVSYREKKKIETSKELGEIVKMSLPKMFRNSKIHPATKTFQALRIAVNDELASLKVGLQKGYDSLKKQGKMLVISFHSLEDRIVKNFYKEMASKNGSFVSKKPIRPSIEEVLENPRSRSAKMRVLQKI